MCEVKNTLGGTDSVLVNVKVQQYEPSRIDFREK